ncbi:hypothetical protein QBC41DRAFT_379403 [Cercophora samala]|uniref:Uncharacterized protein n=1 Tax=Cercophora samala TaxID=330535 RepID=A0AA40DDJ9_9PEZI|nr:hypothetical protein QBC41DRAFT_379403 [Cercophora samala]
MKLTLTTPLLAALTSIQGVLSAPAVANSTTGAIDAIEFLTKRQSGAVRGFWECQLLNGPGHAALRADHADFNRKFGDARLTAVAGQCYVGRCRGRDFAWCNISAGTRTEYANQRNVVADTDPGNRKDCIYNNNADMYTGYYWGTSGAIDFTGADIRRC